VRNTPAMGKRYVEPVTDTMESIYSEMTAHVPVIFLLSVGADPTEAIETLAKRKKQSVSAFQWGRAKKLLRKKQLVWPA